MKRAGKMSAINELNQDELLGPLEYVSFNWLTLHGSWFQAVKRKHGMEAASFCNQQDIAWYSEIEAQKLWVARSGGIHG